VPTNDPIYQDIHDINEVPKHMLIEIEHFFTSYKKLDKRHVESFGWENKDAAIEAIKRGQDLYKKGKKSAARSIRGRSRGN
jgi:inorganic pyrophosphatase